MIDYRANAERRRRLGYRRLRSYVQRRPGARMSPAEPGVATGAPLAAGDPWKMVAPFAQESPLAFVANKLRYSFLYRAVGLLVVLFCVLVSSFLAVTYTQYKRTVRVAAATAQARPDLIFLVLGADDMKHERGRSDAIMLLRADMKNRRVRALSVPRDSYVELDHKGLHMDKLNHAYFFGGPALAKATIEKYTGIKVDYYGVVNYALFERVVDLAGGVPINVEKRMDYDDNAGNLHVHLAPGQQTLDGVQAKGYVRFRHDALGDIGRMRRQQTFAKALLQRLKSPKVIALMALNLGDLFSYVNTDVPLDLALGLLYHFKDLEPQNIEVKAIPAESQKIWAPRYKLKLSFMLSKPEQIAEAREWLLAAPATAVKTASALPAAVATPPASVVPAPALPPAPKRPRR
jgi:LCP family protein required for cell wall assembly